MVRAERGKAEVSAKIAAVVLVLALRVANGPLWAQDTNAAAPTALAPAAPAAPPVGGLQIRSVSAYASYYSSFTPTAGAGIPTTSGSSDAGSGGSIVFDWTKFTDRSSFSLIYTPSFTAYVRDSNLNALNHALSMTTSRKVAPRWTFDFSVGGNLSSLEETLFAPTALGNVASVPSTFDDLAAGLLSSKFTNNPQLGAALTSSPLVESPVGNLFYGERMFTGSARVSLSYSYSPRLSVTFSGGGSRTQHVSDDKPLTAGNTALIPNTTSGSAGVGFFYSLSPFTTLGGTASTNRTSSPISDAYNTTSQASLGRTLGMRWVMQIHGGVAVSTALRETTAVVVAPAKPGPAFGGSLAYKTFWHTFLGSYDRTVVDSYGLGASTTSSATAAWRWGHPGIGSWWLDSSFTWQQLQGGALANTSGWHATIGLSRAIGTHAVLITQYAYEDYSGGLLALTSHFSQSAVRVSIAWTPRPVVLQ
jgi:hypothetical protein